KENGLVEKGLADAEVRAGAADKQKPLNGYFYRLLLSGVMPGDKTPRSYVEDGKLIERYAFVAWPEVYGVWGKKSFIMSYTGEVLELDLGADTVKLIENMDAYDPNYKGAWQPPK